MTTDLNAVTEQAALSDLAREDTRGATARALHRDNAYPMLDWLRFGAALEVMLAHLRDQYFFSYGDTQAGSGLFKAVFFFSTRLGLESVLMFFVLSGFLVGGASLEKILQHRFSPYRYAIDRLTRIYTPLAPALLFALILCLMFHLPFSWSNFSVNLFSLQGVFGDPFPASGALWSLSYEVWFYVLFGALFSLAALSQRSWKLLLLIPILFSGFVFSRLVAAYLFVWVGGMAAYFLGRTRNVRLVLPIIILIIVLGVVLTQTTSNTTQANFSRFRFIDQPMAILVLALGLAPLASLAAHVRLTSHWGRRFADLGGILAGFSYSLYLIHLPMEQLLLSLGLLHRHDRLDAGTLAGYGGLALLMLAAAYIFYLCFERQTSLLRRRLYALGGIVQRSPL